MDTCHVEGCTQTFAGLVASAARSSRDHHVPRIIHTTAKQALYAKHDFRLIELGDAEIERLDDVLPRLLLKFGIESA